MSATAELHIVKESQTMRTLAAALTARLTKSVNDPAVTVTIDDRHAGIHRPRWSLFATDTVPDGPSAMGVGYAGAFIRAYVNPTTHTLSVQRVTDPTVVAQWKVWTQLETNVMTSQIALAWDGNTRQYLFWQRTNGAIKYRYSTDDGATWSAAVAITTLSAGQECTALCATLNAGEGTCYVYYAVHTTKPDATRIYFSSKAETSGSFSTPAECLKYWTTSSPPANMRGLAIRGVGTDLHILACYDSNLYAYTVPAATPTDWPANTTIVQSDDPTRYYSYPSIALNFDQTYYLFTVENNTAAATTTLQHISAYTWDIWTAALRPYQMTSAYGANAAGSLTHHYLCTSRYIYKAARWDHDAPTQRVDVSADILSLQLQETLDAAGQMTLTLRNDDGRYQTDLPGSASYQAIRRGSQITPRLGYTVSGVALQEYYRHYWITDIRHNRQRRRSHLVITATDGWGLLYLTTTDRAHTWTSRTIQTILTAILSGYGFEVTTDSNAVWSTVLSSFVLPPETPLGRPVKHILDLVGGHLNFRTDETWETHWPSAVAHLFVPTLVSAYTLGTTHAIESANYTTHRQRYNQIRATNTQTNRLAADWTSIENDNQARTDARLDVRLSAADLANLAANALADEHRTTDDASVTIAPHPGVEIADTLTVQDSIITLNTTYLVTANKVLYDTTEAKYDQTLTLGHNT